MPEERIREIIREELSDLLKSDAYTFTKHIKILGGRNIHLSTLRGTRIGTATGQLLGFYNAAPVSRQTSGANLTNNVTSGGTNDTIANYTDLSIYANDAAAIRNDLYQLARTLKSINDGLRTLGLFS